MKKATHLLIATAFVFCWFTVPSVMDADGTWVSLNGASWTNAANWSGGVIANGAG